MESLRPTHIFLAFQQSIVAIPCLESPEHRADTSNWSEIAMFVAIQTNGVTIQTHDEENINYQR